MHILVLASLLCRVVNFPHDNIMVQEEVYISPQQTAWHQIDKAFELLKQQKNEQAYAEFSKMARAHTESLEKENLNLVNASFLGLLISADKLKQLDQFYSELGRFALSFVEACYKDLDDLEDDLPSFSEDLSAYTHLSIDDLMEMACSCSDNQAKNLSLCLLEDEDEDIL